MGQKAFVWARSLHEPKPRESMARISLTIELTTLLHLFRSECKVKPYILRGEESYSIPLTCISLSFTYHFIISLHCI